MVKDLLLMQTFKLHKKTKKTQTMDHAEILNQRTIWFCLLSIQEGKEEVVIIMMELYFLQSQKIKKEIQQGKAVEVSKKVFRETDHAKNFKKLVCKF